MFSDAFEQLLTPLRNNTRKALLAERNQQGFWEGELSSSALSTATALCALEAYLRVNNDLSDPLRSTLTDMITRGREWLLDHQNEDGGWGDTRKSFTNISTTLLVWGALNTPKNNRQIDRTNPQRIDKLTGRIELAVQRVEQAIERLAGGLTPEVLAPAIRARYGKDQTFSVPILMALAATGRLGETEQDDPWKWVPQLPFELAAFPRSWFAALQLPVVSYALPALIAIGLVRHRQRPSRNPFARLIRSLATKRTLRVLESIQPSSGGFLEAIPLTSFVAISLIGAGQGGHRVTKQGIEFLINSFRSDGSWAIDTHLATWVSTLSINALSVCEQATPSVCEQATPSASEQATPSASEQATPSVCEQARDQDAFHGDEALKSLRWLLDQQYKTVHPYTMAKPGGWSWTPLSGGVPDADDTPGAMLALRAFFDQFTRDNPSKTNESSVSISTLAIAAHAASKWLLGLQNGDGGIPTFCKGWGTLPFDRSNPDITAHCIRAWLAWFDLCDAPLQASMQRGIRKAMRFLAQCQRVDGAWIPLWFGNQHAYEELNLTYGTSRVLLAWIAADNRDWLKLDPKLAINQRMESAVKWLLEAQSLDGGWGGAVRTESSIEETALAIDSLASFAQHRSQAVGLLNEQLQNRIAKAIERGVQWLQNKTNNGSAFEPSPIGFYFAKLWYFEKHYPLVYCTTALERTMRLILTAKKTEPKRTESL
jgi:squalene-hopene/tetraprenyl-beta-curcumene cyclase